MNPKLAPAPRVEALPKGQPLSGLLPYDPGVKTGPRLLDGFKEYRLLLVAARHAFEAYSRGELRQFDPLVGENACQIRAVKVALIAMERAIEPEKRREEIGQVLARLEELEGSAMMLVKSEVSLGDFLEKGLEIQFTDDEMYLIQSYLLTRAKVSKPFTLEKPILSNDITQSVKIKEIGSVGSIFAKYLVKNLRERLAVDSVRAVQMFNETSSDSSEFLGEAYLGEHNGLQCLPYYWMTQAVMKKAIEARVPIVMQATQKVKDQDYRVVEKVTLCFCPIGNQYKEVSIDTLDPNLPAIYLSGTTCRNAVDLLSREQWIEELTEHCPIDVVLAYAAAHRQYPESVQGLFLLNLRDANYESHKQKADAWGCCLMNPARFFLSHAFCDRVGNHKSFA